MHRFSALILSFAVAAALGCGSSANSGSIGSPTPVQAAAYSNASLTGTYALSVAGGSANGFADSSGAAGGVGTFTADGNGNLTGGTLSSYLPDGASCTEAFTGTYTVMSDGSGTATLTFPSATGCSSGFTWRLSIQAAMQGQSVAFAESDGNGAASGVALRK